MNRDTESDVVGRDALRRVHGRVAFFLLLFALGCASPRVVEVTSRTRLQDVNATERTLFENDKASRIHYKPQDLPAGEQCEEFYVRWRARDATQVKFEYRQLDKPNTVQEQTYVPQGDSSTVFTVGGEGFRAGGPVAAWRVSLWNGDTLLAERKSALW